jgi:hypothetical protein
MDKVTLPTFCYIARSCQEGKYIHIYPVGNVAAMFIISDAELSNQNITM